MTHESPASLNSTRWPDSSIAEVIALRCSRDTRLRRTPSPAIAAAAMKVPASMRSGITVCSTPCSSLTPSITMRRVPAPEIFAPIELRKFARSSTSGSAAADSMMVMPSASVAAIMTLSVPSTVGPCVPRKSISAPRKPFFAVSKMLPPSTSTLAPRASSPRKWRSTGRSPITQPPGSETTARPLRASSGPITQIDARMRRTRS